MYSLLVICIRNIDYWTFSEPDPTVAPIRPTNPTQPLDPLPNMVPLKGPCSADDICDDPNAQCINGTCLCHTSYYEQGAVCSTYRGNIISFHWTCKWGVNVGVWHGVMCSLLIMESWSYTCTIIQLCKTQHYKSTILPSLNNSTFQIPNTDSCEFCNSVHIILWITILPSVHKLNTLNL